MKACICVRISKKYKTVKLSEILKTILLKVWTYQLQSI